MTAIIRLPISEQSQDRQNIAINQLAEMVDSGRAGSRQALTADRTYYVLTTGSDNNTGLVNTAGGAFLTIQKAIDATCALDLSIYAVTINVGAGTYTTALTLKSYLGTGPVTILGDETTPANVLISVTSNTGIAMDGVNGKWVLRGVKITTITTGNQIDVKNSTLDFKNIEFGAAASAVYVQLYCHAGAVVTNTGNYKISGLAYVHAYCTENSNYYMNGTGLGGTITITGTPAFTQAFVGAFSGAIIQAGSMTFSGSATGRRYDVELNAVIITSAGGLNYFPGNAAGIQITGGQYQ